MEAPRGFHSTRGRRTPSAGAAAGPPAEDPTRETIEGDKPEMQPCVQNDFRDERDEADMSDVLIDRPELEGLGRYEFGWADSDVAGSSAKRGINDAVVADISRLKDEPEWML